MTPEEQLAFEEEVMRETIAAGRGERDEEGVRDQWSSEDHLRKKYKVAGGMSERVAQILRSNGLKCDGCTTAEATRKITAYREARKRLGDDEAAAAALERTKWSWQHIQLAGLGMFTLIVAGLLAWVLFWPEPGPTPLERAQLEIRLEQEMAARKAAEAEGAAVAAQPSWREREELEEWTPRQQKQFDAGLRSFGSVANGKEKWELVSAGVDGKDRAQCYSHFKLQQLQRADQS